MGYIADDITIYINTVLLKKVEADVYDGFKYWYYIGTSWVRYIANNQCSIILLYRYNWSYLKILL